MRVRDTPVKRVSKAKWPLLLMAVFVMASCSGGDSDFVGHWVGVERPSWTFDIAQSGSVYIITDEDGVTVEASLEGQDLHAEFFGFTYVFRLEDDTLVWSGVGETLHYRRADGTVSPQSQSTIASGTSSSNTAAGTPEPAAGTPEPAAAQLAHSSVLGHWTEPNSSVVVGIGVSNEGQVTAPAATIEIGFPDDRFPDGLQVTAITVEGELVFPGSGCTTGSRPGVLRCAIGDIAGGDSVQLEIVVFVEADVWPGYYDGVSIVEAANYGPIDFGPFPRIVVCGGDILCQP